MHTVQVSSVMLGLQGMKVLVWKDCPKGLNWPVFSPWPHASPLEDEDRDGVENGKLSQTDILDGFSKGS